METVRFIGEKVDNYFLIQSEILFRILRIRLQSETLKDGRAAFVEQYKIPNQTKKVRINLTLFLLVCLFFCQRVNLLVCVCFD